MKLRKGYGMRVGMELACVRIHAEGNASLYLVDDVSSASAMYFLAFCYLAS